MKKTLFLFVFMLASLVANAQNSVYSELFEVYGSGFDNMSSYLKRKGYAYKGYAYGEYDRKKYWFCKNCSINTSICRPQSSSRSPWYAWAYVIGEYDTYYEFYTNSYETFATTKKTAIRNGYEYESDYFEDDYTRTTYYNDDKFMYMVFLMFDDGTYSIYVNMAGE